MDSHSRVFQTSRPRPHDALSSSAVQVSPVQSSKTCWANVLRRYWLCSVSCVAMTVSERSWVFIEPQDRRDIKANHWTALASIFWVMQCLLRFALGYRRDDAETLLYPRRAKLGGRRYRRLRSHMRARGFVPVGRRISSLFFLLSRFMTANQYRELMSRLTGWGRVSVYRINTSACVLRRRARLVCYDHGWWRKPHTASVSGGLWDVQLPPG